MIRLSPGAAICLALLFGSLGAQAQGAPTQGAFPNETIKLLSTAKTTKGFDAKKAVSEAQLRQIIACGVNAPSAQNKQPWFFSGLLSAKILDELRQASKAAMPAPGSAAQAPGSPGAAPGGAPKGGAPGSPPGAPGGARDPLDNATAAILISGDKDWRWSGTDCALACEAMSVAAQSLGLGTHIVLGPVDALQGKDGAALKKKLGVPADKEPLILLLVGHPASEADAVSRASARVESNYSILK